MNESTEDDSRTTSSGMSRRALLTVAGVGAVAGGAVAVEAMAPSSTPATAEGDASTATGTPGGGPDNWYTSDAVNLEKVSFRNQYGMRLTGNLFTPVSSQGALPAVVVGHPMGAVKEQSSNLYATKLAEQGFAALAIDQSFWGESEGEPRQAVLPDVYTEAFMASVDFIGTRDEVDRERLGVLGICGSGSFVVSAAKLDPRIKAVATVSMYDMGAVNRQGLNNAQSRDQRRQILLDAADQRYAEFIGELTPWAGGTPHELTTESADIDREFYDFYRTPRGEFTPASATPDATTHRRLSAETKFMNFYPFNDIDTISPRPILFISGDQAHSREFSEDAYQRAAQPKELVWVPGAGHVDLYDRTDLIPFDTLIGFFTNHLAA